MSTQDIDQSIVDRITKMLAINVKNGATEEEAQNALAMAERLATAHNLEMADLAGRVGATHGKERVDSKMAGGLYKWQRDLWKAIAELNHSRYWCDEEEDSEKPSAYWAKKYGAKMAWEMGYRGKTWRHRVLGSKLNVMVTTQMADYLQATVERLARDYVGNDPKRYFIAAAIAFREGVADRVVEKLRDKRRQQLREEQERAQNAGAAGGNALVLAAYSKQEEEENDRYEYDQKNGAGAYDAMKERAAKQTAEYNARMEERRKAEAAAQKLQDEWDKAHPAEAAARRAKELRDAAEAAEATAKYWEKFDKRQARNEARRKGRVETYKPGKEDKPGYWDGARAGDGVSLDQQVGGSKKAELLE